MNLNRNHTRVNFLDTETDMLFSRCVERRSNCDLPRRLPPYHYCLDFDFGFEIASASRVCGRLAAVGEARFVALLSARCGSVLRNEELEQSERGRILDWNNKYPSLAGGDGRDVAVGPDLHFARVVCWVDCGVLFGRVSVGEMRRLLPESERSEHLTPS